jgi:formylglycine-generating enzyme required for sulfatase activity
MANDFPVGSFPDGRSRYGLDEVAGNVWEWVEGRYSPYNSGEPRGGDDGPDKPATFDFLGFTTPVMHGGRRFVHPRYGIR